MKKLPGSIGVHALVAAAAAVVVTGCGSPYLQVNEPRPSLPPADGKARVFFIYAAGTEWGTIRANGIITDGLDAIGWIQNSTWFWVDVPAGDHLFMTANKGNISALEASLDAGKTYFVKVYGTMGFNANHLYMKGMGPDDEHYGLRWTWLDTLTQICEIPEATDDMADDFSRKLEKGMAKVESGEAQIEMMPASFGE